MRLSEIAFARINFWGVLFHAAVQLASAEHDAMFAGQADQPNIRPKPHNLPIIATAGVLLAQSHLISKLNLRQHSGIITPA